VSTRLNFIDSLYRLDSPAVSSSVILRSLNLFCDSGGILMKNVVSLLLIIGLVVVGVMNRDKLSGLFGRSSTVEEIPMATPEPVPEPRESTPPPITPHPARESQAQAMIVYPGLKVPNSALNKKFVALYADARHSDPAMLARPDWPMKLAERAMVELGGAPLPVPTPVSRGTGALPGGPLDSKPVKGGRGGI